MLEIKFFTYYRFPPGKGKWGSIQSKTGNHTENMVLLEAATKLRDNEWDFEITGGGTAGQPDAAITINADEAVLDVIEKGLQMEHCTKNELLDGDTPTALKSGDEE